MSSTAKKRIQVASFSMSDISRGHLVAVIAGIVFILGSAALAVASNSNARAAADSKGAARLLLAGAGNAIYGSQMFAGGGSERLAAAASGVNALNGAFADVLGSANSVMVSPALKQPAGEAYSAWNALSATLSNIAVPAGLAADLSENAGKATPHLASLLKKLEASGRQNSTWVKSHESAIRLYSYAESGFGMASVPRVEYDLHTVLTELGPTELRGDVAFLEPLLAVAKNASAKKVTREQLTATYEAALTAKNAAEAMGNASVQTQAALWLGLGAVALGVLGLAAVITGLRGTTSEFSKRYARAMQQFRSDEQAREELMVGLRAASEGDIGADIQVSAASSEVAGIAAGVNRLLAMVRDRVSAASEAIQGGVASGDRAMSVALTAAETCEQLVQRLQSAVEALNDCAKRSGTLSLDSRALTDAAGEAAARSADATRAAQDASARLESMRDGLQDTAKRIKRLGERSQEINGVVDAMELMTEQIGVLALNASLEAERAGEAGAGFRMVAREVQALATRSEAALESIAGLVQGVQSDARAAAESVERSTSQVAAGANVGAVSMAMLNVMAPLAESIGAMATGLESGAQTNVEAASESARAADDVRRLVRELAVNVEALKAPVGASQSSLSSGLTALADMQSGVELA